MVKNTEIFQNGLVVRGDLPKWKTLRFFKEVKNTKIFQSSLVVTGDLPTFLEVVRNTMNSQNDFILIGNRPQMEDEKVVRNSKISQNGFIVTGNRPKWKMKRVFKEVWLWWVTYLGEKKWNVLKERHDRAWRRTIQETGCEARE